MFGYADPGSASLSPEAQSRYRSAYCGLCRRIDALHGLRGRFSLSYDLTFLNILLCSLYEGESACAAGCDHCPHPPHPEGGVAFQRPHRLLRGPERGFALLQRAGQVER